jgi:DNA modification methylase
VKIYRKDRIELHHTEALTLLAQLPDDSIDLIATDPPYYKVKGEAWDNQWKSPAEFFAWLDIILVEYHRVLKPGGSLYLFAGPHLATRVELAVSAHFNLLNHIIWRKPTGRHLGCNKESLRKYFPQTEHILFAESQKKLPFVYEPIRRYLDEARIAAGVTRKQIDQACGCQMAGHWFDRSQWSLPSEAHYRTLNALFGTLKYTPSYPSQPFASLDAARGWVNEFVRWYNHEHRHSGIRFVTPAQRHLGLDKAILAARKGLYEAAKQQRPERWSGETRNWSPIAEVWLNPENTAVANELIRKKAA